MLGDHSELGGEDQLGVEPGQLVRFSIVGSSGMCGRCAQHTQRGQQVWGCRAKQTRKQAPSLGQRPGRVGASRRSGVSGTREMLGAKLGLSGAELFCVCGMSDKVLSKSSSCSSWTQDQRNVPASLVVKS